MSDSTEQDAIDTESARAQAGPTLRPVRDADADFLLRVYAGTRHDVSRALWTGEQRQAFLRMQCDAQRTDYERRFPDAEHSIVLVGGVPAGRLWVDRRADEIRLLDIALLPECCGRGTGTALLRGLLEESRLSARPLRHSVLKENVRALRFYSRMGFEEVEDFGLYVLMEQSDSVGNR